MCSGRSNGQMWNNDIKVLKVVQFTLTIEAHVLDQDTQVAYWFIGIYASSVDSTRKKQWKVIEQRKRMWRSRWIIAGDLNDIISNKEKWGGTTRAEWSFKDFRNFITDNQLIDIGFEGNPWTWSNN